MLLSILEAEDDKGVSIRFFKAIPIFFNRLSLKTVFSLSDGYKIFTSKCLLWIEICENVA